VLVLVIYKKTYLQFEIESSVKNCSAMKTIVFLCLLITLVSGETCPDCADTPPLGNSLTCTCPSDATKQRFWYSCGPTCDAVGDCCTYNYCPLCSSLDTYAYSDSSCMCPEDMAKTFVTITCGPGCYNVVPCCNDDLLY
jgi:hypothetical protein